MYFLCVLAVCTSCVYLLCVCLPSLDSITYSQHSSFKLVLRFQLDVIVFFLARGGNAAPLLVVISSVVWV